MSFSVPDDVDDDVGERPTGAAASSSFPRAPSTVSSPGASLFANTNTEKLYVRVGQPVQGCELAPFATLVNRGLLVGEGAELSFKWMRTVAPAFPCAYSRCKQNEAAMSMTSPDVAAGSSGFKRSRSSLHTFGRSVGA